MEFKLTDDIERQLKAGESITIADAELLCLRFTIKLSKIQGTAYELATYVDVEDYEDIYIDGVVIHYDSDLQATVNDYLGKVKCSFSAAIKQLTTR